MGDVIYPNKFKKKEKKILEFPHLDIEARLKEHHLFRLRAEEFMKTTGKTWRDLTRREREYIRLTMETNDE